MSTVAVGRAICVGPLPTSPLLQDVKYTDGYRSFTGAARIGRTQWLGESITAPKVVRTGRRWG